MTPEGVSVLVESRKRVKRYLIDTALRLAREQYPHVKLTGKVLMVGLDELGQHRHEVVLEVEP